MTISSNEKPDDQRRQFVLDTALSLFCRFGYRKTSMEDVAKAAKISRQGLYFYFTNKQDLFREAVIVALENDVRAAQQTLEDSARPLRDRLIEAFDDWTGRYIGPMTQDVALLVEDHPDIFGSILSEYPQRFKKMVLEAIVAETPTEHPELALGVTQTLLGAAFGFKHQVDSREAFLERMTTAVDLLIVGL